MVENEIKQAIGQVKAHCDLLMPNYVPVSMRGALYDLGYSLEQADEVIEYVALQGFDYCLDPLIKSESHFMPEGRGYPSADACYWGPDQLKSRLGFIR